MIDHIGIMGSFGGEGRGERSVVIHPPLSFPGVPPAPSRVDEKEGVLSSRFWTEERDGERSKPRRGEQRRGDGRDERDGRERRDNPSTSLSSPPFTKFGFNYHSKLGLRNPSENSRPGRGASTYET
ncbi:hypothetical protein C8J56DRAFT_903035 [Mycena floridula]|nr:hypothetical protein C8J56DRAFT_903035 [Mycena floridula]